MTGPRSQAAGPLAVAGLALAVYALTLYPDLAGGDSPELVAAVATGGVIHPPGYPLYELLGRAFLLFPHGGAAFRLNLMSAVCDAAAASVLTLAVTRWSGSRAGGIVAGVLLAFAPGVWRYAIAAEVFALGNLLVALVLLAAVAYREERELRWALAGALTIGLGLSDHHTIVFTAAPLVVWVAWTGRGELLRPRPAALLLGALALGLTPYLALPLFAAHHAPVTWGAADTWTGFWTHVLRREYGTFRLAPEGVAAASSPTARLGAWAAQVGEDLGFWGMPLSAVGLYAAVRAPRPGRLELAVAAALAASVGVIVALGNLPVDDALHRGIVARFWQQPAVHLCAFAGLGVAWLEARAPQAAIAGLTGAVALLPPALRFRAMDESASRVVRGYGAEILRAAPPGALLVTRGDLVTSSVRYLQAVEGQRPDVRLVDEELLGFAWYGRLVTAAHPEVVLPGERYAPGEPGGYVLKALLDDNASKAPILLCGGTKPWDRSADGTYGRWPLGLCELVHRGDEPVQLAEWIEASGAALPKIDFTGVSHPPGSWEDIVWSDMWEVQNARAAHLIEVAGAEPSRRPYLAVAAGWLAQSVQDNPDRPPHVYRNLAIALGRAGLETPAQKAQAAEAWRQFVARSPPDDPQLPAIRQEIERLQSR